MIRRLAVGAALAAALTLSLGACTNSADATDHDSSAPSAGEKLAAAVTKTSGVSMKIVLAGDRPEENLQGSYDGATKMASFTQTSDGETMNVFVAPDDLYLSGLTDLAGKTMRMQISKLPTNNAMALFADPVAPLTLLPAATEVASSGSGGYTGTIDLARVAASTTGATKFLEYVKGAAGEKASAITFTATVDGQGYLTTFKATFPGLDDGKDSQYDLTLSEFGTTVSLTRPAGENVIDAPDTAYQA